MRWEEMADIEAMLETIWDLHDRISDAIHAISRSHFLSSIKTLPKPSPETKHGVAGGGVGGGGGGDNGRNGFVFAKEFRVDDDAAMAEARSLNSIRTALENLEDRLEFFHTVQSQQRAERDAALARLKQSRIILALRLADHQGKKYKVIEEALRFVSDVHDEGRLVAPEALYESGTQPGGNMDDHEPRVSPLIRMLISSFTLARNSLKWERMGGVLGNAALLTVSMLAILQLHQVAFTTPLQLPDQNLYPKRIGKSDTREDILSQIKYFDVFSAKG